MLRIMALVCASFVGMSVVTSLASAQFYAEGRVGVAILPTASSQVLVPGPLRLPAIQEFGVGATGGVAVGYGFDSGVRTEFNIQVQGNDFEMLRVLGYIEPNTGEAISVTPMFDLLYDIRIGESPFVPFVGVGVGLLYTTVSPANALIFQIDDNATSFAWEVVGGLAWEFSDRFAATANYRYLGTAGTQEFRILVPGPQVLSLLTELSSHNITFGLRYTFTRGGGS